MKKSFLIFFLLGIILCPNVSASEKSIDAIEQEFISCNEAYTQQEQKCPESWSMKCYDHLMSNHKTTRQCFQKVAVKLFEGFYGLSKQEAEKRFDDFYKFIYDQYFFIFAETDFCKKNNCGLSIYLYTEYVTIKELHHFIEKIIVYMKNQ